MTDHIIGELEHAAQVVLVSLVVWSFWEMEMFGKKIQAKRFCKKSSTRGAKIDTDCRSLGQLFL